MAWIKKGKIFRGRYGACNMSVADRKLTIFRGIVCGLIILLQANFLFAQTGSQPFAIVELFSSEGCSSCPPAEKLLSKISSDAKTNHRNIFCLEYHVDYWNRLGWKDPFSKNQFTMRQNNYSSVLHHSEIYTPQMIVNGETEFIGSDNSKADAAIDKAMKEPVKIQLTVKIDSVGNDSLYIQYVTSKADKNLSIHYAIVEDNLPSKINKGENAGKNLIHNNIVRTFYSNNLNDQSGAARIPLKGFSINRTSSLISFIQNKQTMKIIGAAKNNLDQFSEK
jgi:hypothetical protein